MTRIILAALLTLIALSAQAQTRTLTDQYGRTVTVSADGTTYTVAGSCGFSANVQPLAPGDDAGALRTINGMAPCDLPSPPNNPVVGKAAFLGRFTAAELTAIATAAQSNAGVNVWLITAQAHDSIDLSDPLTKQGLDALVAAGLITAARETAILTP